MLFREYISPCGVLMLAADDGKIKMCDWLNSRRHKRNIDRLMACVKAAGRDDAADDCRDNGILDILADRLGEYFVGERKCFGMEVEPVATNFQNRVWQELVRISYGMTVSYSVLAKRIGCPEAVRAVANAVGANPLSILIPCHRIVGAGGMLTGYAGGIEAKRRLLALESAGCDDFLIQS